MSARHRRDRKRCASLRSNVALKASRQGRSLVPAAPITRSTRPMINACSELGNASAVLDLNIGRVVLGIGRSALMYSPQTIPYAPKGRPTTASAR